MDTLLPMYSLLYHFTKKNLSDFTGPRKFVRISSQNWRPPSKSTTIAMTESDTLNSIGSENGSLSDIHSERYYSSLVFHSQCFNYNHIMLKYMLLLGSW